MRNIDLAIVGAQKAGTTSVASYLESHPDIVSHKEREFTYFVNDEEYASGYEKIFPSYFGSKNEVGKKLLIKNVGLMYHSYALDRLKEHNDNCKIIVCLRNPVDRAYSAFWYMKRMGWEDAHSFEEALDLEYSRLANNTRHAHDCAYVHRGLYADQLKKLFFTFNKSNISVIFLEELKKDSQLITDLLNNLGLRHLVIPNIDRVKNASSTTRFSFVPRLMSRQSIIKKSMKELLPNRMRRKIKENIQRLNEIKFEQPPMHNETRSRLYKIFEKPNHELEILLERDLPF
jgi:hypothetical protein